MQNVYYKLFKQVEYTALSFKMFTFALQEHQIELHQFSKNNASFNKLVS